MVNKMEQYETILKTCFVKETRHKIVYIVLIHSYKLQVLYIHMLYEEEAKLIYGNLTQNKSCLQEGTD